MNKIITLIVLAVIVVGGGTAIVLTNKDKDTKNSTTQSSQSAVGSSSPSDSFNALPTSGQSFVATLTSTVNSKTVTTVMESDAKTNAVRYASETMTMIYTKDAYYICQTADNCFKYKLGQGNGASFNPKDYEYDASKIEDYKNSTKKLGTESCPAGTCTVWQFDANGYSSKIYVDNKTKRVSQVMGGKDGTTSKIVYDYKDVSVQIPTNAKDLSALTTPTQ